MKNESFVIQTLGGQVSSQVTDNGRRVRVEMGKVSFNAAEIPVIGESGEVVERELIANGKKFIYTAATIGNPHCIIPMDALSPELAKTYGPLIEINPKFPQRTNVQFLKIIDPDIPWHPDRAAQRPRRLHLN